MIVTKENLKFLLLIAIYIAFMCFVNTFTLEPLILIGAWVALIALTGIFFQDTLFKIKQSFVGGNHLNRYGGKTELSHEETNLNNNTITINQFIENTFDLVKSIHENPHDNPYYESQTQKSKRILDTLNSFLSNTRLAPIPNIALEQVQANSSNTNYDYAKKIFAQQLTLEQIKQILIGIGSLDYAIKYSGSGNGYHSHFHYSTETHALSVSEEFRLQMNTRLYVDKVFKFIFDIIPSNEILDVALKMENRESALNALVHLPSQEVLSKVYDSDYYVKIFKASLEFYLSILKFPSHKTLEERNATKNNFLRVVNSVIYKHINYTHIDNHTVIFEIFKSFTSKRANYYDDSMSANYYDDSIKNHPNIHYAIKHFLELGAKLNLIVPNQELTYLAFCEKYLPITLVQINQIQFEYVHNSRWQKLLDMGALTKDVDLYIYNLVYQNPQLIVENQTLKTLFCQILSQENRPHIDLIWEAYHDNVVQHPLTYVIENFLSKKPSKLTPHNALETNIMEDPLSFTTGYCHYLGKDVLFFLDNNLDERKSLLTTKLYQSKIKPYLLPPSINHSLFSQLCQNKNASDLGQHRFDQRYGVTRT